MVQKKFSFYIGTPRIFFPAQKIIQNLCGEYELPSSLYFLELVDREIKIYIPNLNKKNI